MKAHTININNFDNHLLIRAMDQSNLIDHVPAMVYKAAFTPQGLVLFKDRQSFTLPQLRFGKHNRHFRTITESYERTGKSLGVLLAGEKGSGKSLMAEELSNWAIRQDIPVVMITESMSADDITTIIRAIGPCVVYFDEFGKTYHDQHERANLLTLFSDTSFNGTMFVITGNNGDEFSAFLHHRPQRFKYAIHYQAGIDAECFADIMKVMNVDEKFHDYLRIYTQHQSIALNIDSFLTVVRMTASCKDEVELAEACEILNVPALPKKTWTIAGVKDLTAEEAGDRDVDHGWAFSIDRFSTTLCLEEVVDGHDFGRNCTRHPLSYPADMTPFKHMVHGVRTYEVSLKFDYEIGAPNVQRQPKTPELLDIYNSMKSPFLTSAARRPRIGYGEERAGFEPRRVN